MLLTRTIRRFAELIGVCAVSQGGTGAGDAPAALANLGAAPLASPAFTGAPTAPTATVGTNSTQVATTAFVLANAPAPPVASVFGRTGAVGATTGDYSVGQVTGAAPLASPAFTGTPTAPTATGGTSTTQVATTGFVHGEIVALGLGTASTHAAGDFAASISLTTPNVLFASPVTFTNTTGSFAGSLTLNNQAANTVLRGPTSGAAAAPTFGPIVVADLPIRDTYSYTYCGGL